MAKRKAKVKRKTKKPYRYNGEAVSCYVCEKGLTTADAILTMPSGHSERLFLHRACYPKVGAKARQLHLEATRG